MKKKGLKMTITTLCVIFALVIAFLMSGIISVTNENTLLKLEIDEQDKEIEEMEGSIAAHKKTVKQLTAVLDAYRNDIALLKNVKLTAYCPCDECSEGLERQTKSGATATEGRTVAVDKELIPLGSTVIINGKEYKAEDTGGKVEGLHIDVYMENHKATDDFGIKTADKVIVIPAEQKGTDSGRKN